MPKKPRFIKKGDENKAWNRKQAKSKPHKSEQYEKKKSFLIVCEGENTEPNYFKSFPVVSAIVRAFGYGITNIQLVNEAIKLKKSHDYKDFEVWCVFDYDINPNIESQKNDYEN
ncbi:MAG: RloB family protein, partial [Bacteroidia bacterium]